MAFFNNDEMIEESFASLKATKILYGKKMRELKSIYRKARNRKLKEDYKEAYKLYKELSDKYKDLKKEIDKIPNEDLTDFITLPISVGPLFWGIFPNDRKVKGASRAFLQNIYMNDMDVINREMNECKKKM